MSDRQLQNLVEADGVGRRIAADICFGISDVYPGAWNSGARLIGHSSNDLPGGFLSGYRQAEQNDGRPCSGDAP
jgi:hypothetical protein